ncbi:MAG: SagB/ThcOx family dehydrogenase [Victivallaceae bacterium]
MKRLLALIAVLSLGSLIAAEDLIKLPPPQKTGGMPLMEAITARRTRRDMTAAPLSLQQLSDICYVACGISREDGRRTIPTARNIQDLMLYVALKDGLYLYNPKDNALELKEKRDLREFTGIQKKMHQNSAAVLIYASDYDRFGSIPEDTRVFYAANHAGYASQNVYLYAASTNLATVVCNAVDKPKLSREMKLPPNLKIQLTQPLGPPATLSDK